MVYGCCRVSTKQQLEDGNSIEDQKAQILEKYPEAEIVVEAYTGGEQRPIFSELLEKVQNCLAFHCVLGCTQSKK